MSWVLDVAVGVPLVSLVVGVAAIGAGQDRESIRRQRGIAKALLADVGRIDAALSKLQDARLTPSDFELEVEIPAVHPWVESLIVQIADEQPRVVEEFMHLREAWTVLGAQRSNARELLKLTMKSAETLERVQAEADANFARGEYQPLSDTSLAPSTQRDVPPDDEVELSQWVSDHSQDGEAAAKLEHTRAVRQIRGSLAEYQVQKAAARGIIMTLAELLEPMVILPVPPLLSLVYANLFPEPQDQVRQRQLLDEARARQRLLAEWSRSGEA